MSEFGIVASVSGIGLVVFAVADFGLGSYVSKARAHGNDADVATVLFVNSVSTFSFGVLFSAAMFVLFLVRSGPIALVGLAIAFALEKNIDTVLGIAVADGNRWTPGISIIIRRLLGLAVFWTAVTLGVEPVTAYCSAYLISCVIGQIHMRGYVRRAVSRESLLTRSPTRELLKTSWPFLANNLAGQARTLDTALIAAISGPHIGGLYAAASRLTTPLLLIPGAFTTVIMPHATRGTPKQAQKTGWQLLLISLAITTLLIPATVFSSDLMSFVYGSDFRSAGPAFGWTIVGMTFIALSSPLATLLQSQGHERMAGWTAGIFAALTLLGVAFGTLIDGATGGAAAVAIVFAIKCLVLCVGLWSPRFGNNRIPLSTPAEQPTAKRGVKRNVL